MGDSSEKARIQALRGYGVLDTPADPHLDAIVKEAARHFDVPIALLSLVDADRQWFKAKVGLDIDQTPRQVSFCSHTVALGKTMVITDASDDERFSSNPLVTGDPNIRFYAGAPLRSSTDHIIGTICVIDNKPRKYLEKLAVDKLEALASEIMKHVEEQGGPEVERG